MARHLSQNFGWATGSNPMPPLSEFVVTEKTRIKPVLRKVSFYDWDEWNKIVYQVDHATRQYLIRRPKPTDVEIILDQEAIDKGYEILWDIKA